LPQIASAGAAENFILTLSPDPSVFDGGFANNAWLQECPKPFTKQVWGNALHLAESDALALKVVDGDVVRLAAGALSLEAPILVRPGQAAGVIEATLGYGRTAAGSMGSDIGFDVYRLRPVNSPWAVANVSVTQTGRNENVLRTQHFFALEGEAEELQPRFTLADLSQDDLNLSKPSANGHGVPLRPVAPDLSPPRWGVRCYLERR
jgi:anaerobic selenocysteine-containing dehydrogenase